MTNNKNPNPLTVIDFYKTGHIKFYDEGTEYIYSNFTPRSTKYLPHVEGTDDKIVCFGLQYFIKYFLIDLFNQNFFEQPKDVVVKNYQRRMDFSLGKGVVDTKHIEDLHDLGYLPIAIKALPEGTVINARIPYFTIINTLPQFFWLTNYLEDALSCSIWRASTSATIARKYKKIATNAAIATGADTEFVKFQLHDFQLRGTSSIQDAMVSGAGFLLSMVGTDNIPAIDFLEDYYNADAEKELIGCSVAANEHSCVCAGRKEYEFDNYKRWISETYPNGIVSLVSDTWDLWNVVTNYLPRLKDIIMSRDGKVVIRPDSSPKTPLEIICGDPEAPKNYPQHKGLIELLWDIFGGTVNREGYKELDSHIGAIYGEGISLALSAKIFERLKEKGFASTNILLGIGSMSFVLTTRDTCGWAAKATYCEVNGEARDIFKDPVTDDGMKKSAKGLLRVNKLDGEYVLQDCCTWEEEQGGELVEVFRDGVLLVDQTLAEIRARVQANI